MITSLKMLFVYAFKWADIEKKELRHSECLKMEGLSELKGGSKVPE